MCPETVQLSVSIDWCSVQLSQQLLLLRVMCWVHLPLTLLHSRILEGVDSAQSVCVSVCVVCVCGAVSNSCSPSEHQTGIVC